MNMQFYKQWISNAWHDEAGVLSFEWTLLAVIVVFGIVAGLTGARDAFIDEMSDTAEAVLNFDQTYTFVGIPALGIPGSSYTDVLGTVTDCARGNLAGQNGGLPGNDTDS
jgi:Flp pilus assembly pilin Flp